jgi:hypothetical protein
MTGADSRVARDPEALNFLARVAADKRHGSRPWPGFDLQQLESFLSRAGVDLETARKDHAEATEHMPEIVREPERCIPFLKGASFLADGVENVCSGLRRLYQTAPRTFRAGEEGGA